MRCVCTTVEFNNKSFHDIVQTVIHQAPVHVSDHQTVMLLEI